MSSIECLSRDEVRALIVHQVTKALDDYLWTTWKREDGLKIQLKIELNPDLVEYAYGKTS